MLLPSPGFILHFIQVTAQSENNLPKTFYGLLYVLLGLLDFRGHADVPLLCQTLKIKKNFNLFYNSFFYKKFEPSFVIFTQLIG